MKENAKNLGRTSRFPGRKFNPGPTEYVQLCCPLDRDVLYAVRRQCEWHIHVHLNKVTTSLRSTVWQYEHLTKVTKRGPRFIHTKRYSKMWNFLQTGISLKMIIYNTKISSKSLHQEDITYTDSWKLRIQPLTPIWPIRCSKLLVISLHDFRGCTLYPSHNVNGSWWRHIWISQHR